MTPIVTRFWLLKIAVGGFGESKSATVAARADSSSWRPSSTGTSRLESGTFMVVVGVGIGLTMQVVVLATQNAVPKGDLGVATSSINFFRSIGGSVGVAVFGALLNARLSASIAGGHVLRGPELATLPAGARTAYLDGFASAMAGTFAWAVPVAAVGLVLTLAMRELPLRDRATAEAMIAAGATRLGTSSGVAIVTGAAGVTAY